MINTTPVQLHKINQIFQHKYTIKQIKNDTYKYIK